MIRIKICGATTIESAQVIAESGADAIGLNFYGKSKRFVDNQTAKAIRDAVDERLKCVGVFVNEPVQRIQEIAKFVGLDAIQLHGDEPVEILTQLGSIPVIRAFRCRDGDASEAVDYAQRANEQGTPLSAVLLDAYHPGEFGGTGKTIEPHALAGQVGQLGDTHWILAGGLTPENVAAAIQITGACGVDTASGVELRPGIKDPEKSLAFVRNAAAVLRN